MSETKYVLVSGANRGIGRATIKAILKESPHARAFLGSRDIDRGTEALSDIAQEYPEAEDRVDVVQLDVTDDKSVRSAADKVASKLDGDPMYGLINNAGIGDHGHAIREVLDINVRGPRRLCEAFLPMLEHPDSRIVNVSSAAGPNFVNDCSPERREFLTDDNITWSDIERFMEQCIAAAHEQGDFESTGIGDGRPYGLSKALLNAYTMALARNNPELTVNACTPGFIETDMTRSIAERRGKSPEELGMKSPMEGTKAQMFLLFGEPEGSGWYYGSDAERSPLDRYRSPGDPPYTGD